jgi:hypothetical protein
MKKIVLTFGIISGVVMMAMMILNMSFIDKISFDNATILGYTVIVVSFMMVFFGIRSYRENIGGGKITFWKALQVGLLITLISCIFYVAIWEILYFYFHFMPDFVDKYASYELEKARAAGATPEALKAQREQMQQFIQWYQNPFFNAAMTFMEPFPVGLLITLISSALLRRKEPKQPSAEAAMA